jgi:hypothetical protein
MTSPAGALCCAHPNGRLESDFEDDDWSAVDPKTLEDWILDDFDWDDDPLYPERGDFSVDPNEAFEDEQCTLTT